MLNKETPLVDDHLQSVLHLKEAELDSFFYTKLLARMNNEKKTLIQFWSLKIKPTWAISMLGILLVANTYILIEQKKQNPATKKSSNISFQTLSNAYDAPINEY